MKVVVYARTSGDEADTGQDVHAQAAQVALACQVGGSQVVGTFLDDGVSGDTPPLLRPGWARAVTAAREQGAAVAIREISRFSRLHPAQALLEFEHVRVPVLCMKEDHFTTLGTKEVEPATVLLRFVSLWQAWSELLGIKTKTQAAMDEIGAGRRATKSGKPVGRPERAIDPAHLEAARVVIAAGGSYTDAHAKVLELRGWAPTLDPRTAKKRFVGKETLRRALSTQNPSPPKTLDDLRGDSSNLNGPVVGRSDQAETGAVVAGVQPKEPVEPVGGQVVAADRSVA